MLRVMVECKNARSEKVAKYLERLVDGFRIWMHDDAVYALFNIESLIELRELSKMLKHVRNIRFRYVKIWSLRAGVLHE